MTLFVGVVMTLFVLNVSGQYADNQVTRKPEVKSSQLGKYAAPKLLRYKDAFVPGMGGKPALGTMSATCWARGGICVDMRECSSLKIDVSVPGCSWGHKVCCIVQRLLSPTAGIQRRAHIPTIRQLEDLGTALLIIARSNSMLLSNIDDTDQDENYQEQEAEYQEHVDVDSSDTY